MGEAKIYWFHCETNILHSASALNLRIQVEIFAKKTNYEVSLNPFKATIYQLTSPVPLD